tara:strand:+ start:4915 stop:5139 length:225 start_codon:yes stop_codon:yes gene_type:complete
MTSQEKDCLLRLEDKLEQVHKEVKNNADEIKQMKTEMSDMKATINIGRGAVRTLVWVGTIITAIIGAFKIGDNI